jgi:hypothetical protein
MVRFANLKRPLDVLERKVNEIIDALLRYPRKLLETRTRKPFRNPFNCDDDRRELLWQVPL